MAPSSTPAIVNYLDKTYMINEAVFLQPNTAEKYYQQQTLASTPGLKNYAILTYRVKGKTQFQQLIDTGRLSLPIIAKPNSGCRGEGIILIRQVSDFEKLERPAGNYVLQEYIENNGDWRVIVVGGRPIGAMKRVAQEGAFLNNISQGAHATTEEDPEVLKLLYKLAPRVAAQFHLRFCGVDIIRDERTGEYKILEVNTVPQWMNQYGFTNVTGVSVAQKLAEYMKAVLSWKKSGNLLDSIDEYFKGSLELYPHELFHYASRRWLWSRDEWSAKQLADMKAWYLGEDEAGYDEKIAEICNKTVRTENVNQGRAYRRKYYERYDKLPIYNAILFRYLFAQTLYGIDLRPYIHKYISDTELSGLYEQLIRDHDAIRVLSTHAVNFCYLLSNYMNIQLEPHLFLDISNEYDHLVASNELSENVAKKLEVYLLTHVIIGESRFYSRNVENDAYTDICHRLEGIIKSNYFDISLDNKLEFLVCAELCNYKTELRALILQEAGRSVSWAGPFIVDNDAAAIRHIVQTAEHRNVLYVMANSERFEQKGSLDGND